MRRNIHVQMHSNTTTEPGEDTDFHATPNDFIQSFPEKSIKESTHSSPKSSHLCSKHISAYTTQQFRAGNKEKQHTQSETTGGTKASKNDTKFLTTDFSTFQPQNELRLETN